MPLSLLPINRLHSESIMHLPSTIALSRKLRRQMGDYCYDRFCRNLGIDFATTYELMFGRPPR